MRFATALLATATTVATALTAAPRMFESRTAVELIPMNLGFNASRAVAILNNRGDIVIPVAGIGLSRSLVWSGGNLTDLGAWVAYGINDRGQIVGSMSSATVPHAALWDNGQMTDLQPPGQPPSFTSTAVSINNDGIIAGFGSYREGTHYCPCSQFILWDDDGPHLLGVYPNENNGDNGARATAINDRGEIVGWSVDFDPVSRMRAVVWYQSEWRQLAGLTATGPSQANGINNQGQIVGWSEDADHIRHAVIWDGGTIVDLGSPGEATAINERGDVVGTVQLTGPNGEIITRAALWERNADGAVELSPLPGSQNSYALAINNRSNVVGYSANSGLDPHLRATLWPRKGKPSVD